MQRQCETCPNLLPEDSAKNKRFCYDCKQKRKREYLKNYFAFNPRSRNLSENNLRQREKHLLELAIQYQKDLRKLERIEKIREAKKNQDKVYLTERMGDILEHRVNGDMTLEQLGAKWKVSRERIRQLEKVGRKLTGNDIRRDRECKYCHRDFQPTWASQKYCNPVCSRLWVKEHPQIITQEYRDKVNLANKQKRLAIGFKWMVETVCANPGCGNVFMKLRENQKYCGSYSKKIGCSWWVQKHFTDPDGKKNARLHTYCKVCGVELEWRRSGTRFLRNHKYCDTHKEVIRRVSTKIGWHIYPRAEIAEVLRELIKPYDIQQTNQSGEERVSAERLITD